MIDKNIVNSFINTDIKYAKESKTNDNFFTRSPYEVIPEFVQDLNLNFNNTELPSTATKSFST